MIFLSHTVDNIGEKYFNEKNYYLCTSDEEYDKVMKENRASEISAILVPFINGRSYDHIANCYVNMRAYNKPANQLKCKCVCSEQKCFSDTYLTNYFVKPGSLVCADGSEANGWWNIR